MSMLNYETILAQAFLGFPSLLEDIPCLIYPLTMKETCAMGEDKYSYYLGILLSDTEELEVLHSDKKKEYNGLGKKGNLEFLCEKAVLNQRFFLDLQQAFFTFIREEITILLDKQEIVIGKVGDRRILNKDNFLIFQNILRIQNNKLLTLTREEREQETAVSRKFRLLRLKREAAKTQRQAKSGESLSLATYMGVLCTFGIGITPFNVGDLTVVSFYSLLNMKQAKIKYELDIKQLLAGASSSKVKPEMWVKELLKKE